MSDWNRIDPPAAVFGWPNAWLMSLLGGIADDLPAMASKKGMHATVGEALRRLKASRADFDRLTAENAAIKTRLAKMEDA